MEYVAESSGSGANPLFTEDAASVPDAVTGPASRACGGCHRADLINPGLAGDLASLDAHTEAFGTFEENDDEIMVLFGIIDKFMSLFE